MVDLKNGNMKKVFIPTVLILMVALYFGCAKKKTNVEFDIPYTMDVVVPTYSMANETFSFVTNDLTTGITSQFDNNNTTEDLVGEIRITKFDISVKTPTTQGLGFIRTMKFYINAVNQPEVQAAYKYNDKNDSIDPATSKTTSFKINDVNLKNRFAENSVYFKVKLSTYSIAPQTTITISQNVHVKGITK